MKPLILIDSGPLVALLNRRERHHQWASSRAENSPHPFHTCEPVVTEACFLLQERPDAVQALMEWLTRGDLMISLRLGEEIAAVAKLMDRYSNIPMSLADACLVRMAEQHSQGVVFTLDSDFRVYRKHGRQVVPTLMPDDR